MKTIKAIKKETRFSRNSKAISKIRQGLKEAAKGKIEKIKNLESFLNDL